MNKSSCCSTSSPAFGAVSVLTVLIGMQWYLVLICISLMTYVVEHLFIGLFDICVSYLVMCLFRAFAHFLLGLFIFLLLSSKSIIYISRITGLFIMYVFCKCFLLVCGLSSHSLETHGFYLFKVSKLIIISFIFLTINCPKFGQWEPWVSWLLYYLT